MGGEEWEERDGRKGVGGKVWEERDGRRGVGKRVGVDGESARRGEGGGVGYVYTISMFGCTFFQWSSCWHS